MATTGMARLTDVATGLSASGAATFTVAAVSPALVPAKGAWLCAYPEAGNGPASGYETMIGRPLDVVVRYQKFDAPFPGVADQALVAAGRFLTCRWACVLQSGANVLWADITAGKYDAVITAAAQRWAAWGQPMIVSFAGEFDRPPSVASYGGGDLTTFAPAYRHVVDLVRPVAPKIAWAWVTTGYSGNYAAAAQMHPGAGYAGWHGADLYDPAAARTPLATYQGWATWLAAQPFGQAGLPLGIFETGCDSVLSGGTASDAACAAWIRRLPADCAAVSPAPVRLCAWWNSGTAVIPPGSQAAAAMAAAGRDPYFSQPHG